MDREWALEKLHEYVRMHERIPLAPGERGASPSSTTRPRGSKDERENLGHTIQHIAEAVWEDPPWRVDEAAAKRLIWELTQGDEVRHRLGLSEPGPHLEADDLHPWVWDAAHPHWTSGNHVAAVWAAGINVNARLKKKLGRYDLGEQKLIQEAFSTDLPAPGRPRLRLCDNRNPDLFRDLHVGAANLGKGLFAAVRNPVNHVDETERSLSEREALESLAAFSLLARWIDSAKVEHASVE